MRFVQYRILSNLLGNVQLGIQLNAGDNVISLSSNPSLPKTMMDFLKNIDENLAKLHSFLEASDKNRIPLDSIELCSPIMGCDKVLCVGMNYKDHCEELNIPIPVEPVIFNKFPSCLVGPNADIPHPSITEKLDWEIELAIVIGKKCKNVSESEAEKYIFGYTVAHDVSARDWFMNKNGGQWLLGKAMDAFSPLGPCIVMKEDLDVNNLNVSTRVNGALKQKSNTCQLVHKPKKLVSFISKFMTLLPGDVIMTGTPSGVGVFMNPPEFLKVGDEVVLDIEGIGKIKNKIV